MTLLALCFAWAMTPALASSPSPDPNRPDLSRLDKRQFVATEEYEEPFLVTMTSTASSLKPEQAKERILNLLQKGKLPIGSHFGKGASVKAVNRATFPLPPYVVSGDQLEGIKECTVDYCKMKLNQAEKATVQKSKDKVNAYHDLVIDRLKNYLTKKQLAGYEDRKNNVPFVKQALSSVRFFAVTYPRIYLFLSEGFWKGAKPPDSLKTSFLRQEKMFMEFEKMQPTWRFGEVFVFEKKSGQVLIAAIDVYSNHFFDSIFSFYEVLPWGNKSIVSMLDLMEVDELKKSAFIRFLYKGKMQEAVKVYQQKTLEKLSSSS